MQRAAPLPGPGEVRIEVRACGVCRTDLHVVDGELPDPKLPLVPGHQIVARVLEGGSWAAGRRIAREKRTDAGPPIAVISDGTVF